MLTPRLNAIADLVETNESIADIGTDHGYLPLALLESGKISKAIAVDVNEMPLASARKNTPESFKDRMIFRLGNGLAPIAAGEVDLVVIAGMGGELISQILEADWDKTRSIKTFILQPMVKVSHLRTFLYENDFRIVEETMAREATKFYQVIKVVHGPERPLLPIHMEIGAGIIEKGGPALDAFLDFRMGRIDRIIAQLGACGGEKTQEIEDWQRKKQTLLEVKAHVGQGDY